MNFTVQLQVVFQHRQLLVNFTVIDSLYLDRAKGVTRDSKHAYSQDGGLVVLYWNLAKDGCIMKTAGFNPL
ncbi:Dihydroxy-acid dehydratase [Bartonella quintana]|uniref:Dihydroxy-acid dehydratase n=1 Tax=Bartonella quintana JK 73 TaxID=1402976 RepID=W3TZG2_BARQI|nr:dihydroxy-acid dehydratase [Bartonella quintana]ETS14970.1 dihydroxy-acid dehydratase [Bartonella quintana JK 73rel]ETS16810.1 dihydroxy-acid dehydratase [Bartonella quintana JK 73]KEC68650.1 dihydroxy-acid dehydratase [Bartonella quintana JK 39]SQF97062.1 Dihydroxy-acid dehydratase [Bartonella quintana]